MSKIAWIGLGHMGMPMAIHLVEAGHEVKGYDVSRAAHLLAEEAGITVSTSIAETIDAADFIFTMVQTSEQVHDLCLGKSGIFENMKPDAVYIDASSIDIAMTHQLHQDASKRGLRMLDAPVSGGVAGAKAASLTIMVGGERAVFDAVLPVFSCLGKNVVHAGSAGHGQAAKICNNLILAISMIGVSEGFSLAKKLGLNPKTFYDISSVSSGQCWSMTSYCPEPDILPNVPSSHGYEPGFMAKMMLKDLRLAEHAADFVKAFTPLGDRATKLYQQYVDEGLGEKDFSGVLPWITQLKRE